MVTKIAKYAASHAHRLSLSAAVILVIALGTIPYIQLFANHPFESGSPDITTFAQHAKTTIDAQAINARGNHGYYTALQMFPLSFLGSAVMTIINGLHPIINLLLTQTLLSLVSVALFFILGRKLTKSFLGGILTALVSFTFLDIPIQHDGGLTRFLSSFQFSAIFFFSILAFFPEDRYRLPRGKEFIFLLILGSTTFLGHHHFGIIRLGILIFMLLMLAAAGRYWPTLKMRRAICARSALALVTAIALGILSNVQYINYFIVNFGNNFTLKR